MSEDEKNASFAESTLSATPSGDIDMASLPLTPRQTKKSRRTKKTKRKSQPLELINPDLEMSPKSGKESNLKNLSFNRNAKSPVLKSKSHKGLFISFRSNRFGISSRFGPNGTTSIMNLGLLNQLAEDNVMSMRWHSANDRGYREKSWPGFCVSLLLSCLFIVLFMLLFVFLPQVSRFTIDRGNFENFVDNFGDVLMYILYASLGMIGTAYILDLHNGGVIQQKIAVGMYLISAVGLFFGMSFAFKDTLIVPFVIFTLSAPIICGMAKMLFFAKMDPLMYTLGLMFPLAVAVGIAFITYGEVIPFLPWSNNAVEAVYYRQAGCDISRLDSLAAIDLNLFSQEEFDDGEIFEPSRDQTLLKSSVGRAFNKRVGELIEASNDNDIIDCNPRAQFLYFGPALFIIFGFIFLWMMAELLRVSYSDRKNRKLSNLSTSFQIFLMIFGIGVFAAYIATTIIQDPNSPVSLPTILLGFVAVLIGLGVFVTYYVLGVSYLEAQLNRTPIGKRLYQMKDSNIVKAALVYFLLPLYLGWVLIGAVTQLIRKKTPLGKRIDNEAEKKLWAKKEAVDVLKIVQKWDIGKVLHQCMFIGIVYFVVVVIIGRFTTVLFAFLRDILQNSSLTVATIVFVLIGLIMFLLPPVPGLPVYLAGGVILFSNARVDYGDNNAMIYAIVVNFVLKLLAVAAEQKIIGEYFGSNSVSVKSLCGVNSPSLKSIRYILESEGMIVGKIAILCGGPDWPTSVLTGILKLSVWKMLLGTFPVIVLVACSTAAGAFLVLGPADASNCNATQTDGCADTASTAGVTDALRGILLSGTVVIQAVFFILAFHYIAKAVDNEPEQIAKIPNDQEVEAYEKENTEKNQIAEDCRSWDNLDPVFKVGHFFAVILFLAANWTFQFGSALCFVNVDPTEKAKNPFTDAGFGILGLWFVPFIYYMVFNQVISRQVASIIAARKQRHSSAEEIVPVRSQLATSEQLIMEPMGSRSQRLMKAEENLQI